MHAIHSDGALRWAETPTPAPGPGQVRVRVAATAVNRADLLQRRGLYPPPPGASPILGLECSGHVDAVGEGVSRWRPGDAVCALLAGGGYAEQVVCDARQCLPVPEGVGLIEAAALPEVFATAWLNLWQEGGLQPGERVLLHAGASGVGTAAVQLCRLMGNPCWVTLGSEAKLQRCMALGAEGGALRGERPFRERLMEQTGGESFDLILCPVGAAYLDDNQRMLAVGGRLVIIGLMGGARAELDLGRLLVKRQRVQGSVLRARPAAEKGAVLAGLEAAAWGAFADGRLAPVVAARFPIQEAEAAHALVASNQTVGKVLLVVP
ncbi:MAG: NAD(P)H-quinone oxidoreductase [Alphaproteobacteria bacterium]|nr:NAD(P)H-quinone oxidoreductase [Alphaproteobacteria bacterium]